LPEQERLADRLARRILSEGPISVADYMAEANAHYYASYPAIGIAGDFTTSPEISQMFGELVGLCLADTWVRAGRSTPMHYVELGPGRGTLAVDALRAMARVGLDPSVHLIETSPRLREAQALRIPGASWHAGLTTLPDEGGLLCVAKEFFDALPIRQVAATREGWRERMVGNDDGRFFPHLGALIDEAEIPLSLRPLPPGKIVELAEVSQGYMENLADRIVTQNGLALVIDYGHEKSAPGDTLQAVKGHAFANPWQVPGEQDLTAHVDFEALARSAQKCGARTFGPIAQGAWLRALGIEARALILAESAPDRRGEFDEASRRLIAPDQMGKLFKVLAVAASNWPAPESFA